MSDTYTYRISPLHNKIIERKADHPDARWCFYKVCDSAPDAKRSLAIINDGRRADGTIATTGATMSDTTAGQAEPLPDGWYQARIAELIEANTACTLHIASQDERIESLEQANRDLRMELSAYQAAHNRTLPSGDTRQRRKPTND